MTIVVTGGGSGGHITPILAVAHEIKQLDPHSRVVYVGQSGDSLSDIPEQHSDIDEVRSVQAGKFRRYHGEGISQLLDLKTVYLNFRDAVRIVAGIWQSYWLLRRINPDIIFTRGSFVSVPVCLAAALLRIPYVTHDSDAIPSLTNRLIARWAKVHAVALPEELYPYPIDKTITVGVPISDDYTKVTDALRLQYKKELGLETFKHILLVTGGGLGSQKINTAVQENTPYLLKQYKDLAIVHITGRIHESEVSAAYDRNISDKEQRRRVIVKGFVKDLYRYSGAASIVVARAGATNLAELAVQAVPSIIVPAPHLTGGHQLKNTAALQKQGAIIELTEDQIEQELRLSNVVSSLLDDQGKRQQIAERFNGYAHPHAARQLAELLLNKGVIDQKNSKKESS